MASPPICTSPADPPPQLGSTTVAPTTRAPVLPRQTPPVLKLSNPETSQGLDEELQSRLERIEHKLDEALFSVKNGVSPLHSPTRRVRKGTSDTGSPSPREMLRGLADTTELITLLAEPPSATGRKVRPSRSNNGKATVVGGLIQGEVGDIRPSQQQHQPQSSPQQQEQPLPLQPTQSRSPAVSNIDLVALDSDGLGVESADDEDGLSNPSPIGPASRVGGPEGLESQVEARRPTSSAWTGEASQRGSVPEVRSVRVQSKASCDEVEEVQHQPAQQTLLQPNRCPGVIQTSEPETTDGTEGGSRHPSSRQLRPRSNSIGSQMQVLESFNDSWASASINPSPKNGSISISSQGDATTPTQHGMLKLPNRRSSRGRTRRSILARAFAAKDDGRSSSRVEGSEGQAKDLSSYWSKKQRMTWQVAEQPATFSERISRYFGLAKKAQQVQEQLENPESLKGWTWVHGGAFHALSSTIILLNAMFIGWGAATQLSSRMEDTTGSEVYVPIGETVFTFCFMVELGVRLFVERFLFFCGPEWKWNVFDFTLLTMSLVDFVIYANGSSANTNLTSARIVRLVRFFRLARLTRVIRHIGSLRLVLYAILESMSSLLGCFLIIGLAQYLFAVLFMTAVAEYLEGVSNLDCQTCQLLVSYFGGLDRAMVTLFMVISGGLDWQDASEPLRNIHWVYEYIFIGYVFLMHFGVLNVVVGAFVATATETAAKDKQALVNYELVQWERYTQRIREFFQAADTDKSGTLCWSEFRQHLEDRRVKAYFQSMDLDVSQAHVLFELLDEDGSDQVTIDEFLDGCMRLKGAAKSIDMNMLTLMNKRLLEGVKTFAKRSDERFTSLETALNKIYPSYEASDCV